MKIDGLQAKLHTFVQISETGVLYRTIYHAVTSTFRRFMGQYLSEVSPEVYSRGWCALDGRNRPSTGQDMLISVNGSLLVMDHLDTSWLMCVKINTAIYVFNCVYHIIDF